MPASGVHNILHQFQDIRLLHMAAGKTCAVNVWAVCPKMIFLEPVGKIQGYETAPLPQIGHLLFYIAEHTGMYDIKTGQVLIIQFAEF